MLENKKNQSGKAHMFSVCHGLYISGVFGIGLRRSGSSLPVLMIVIVACNDLRSNAFNIRGASPSQIVKLVCGSVKVFWPSNIPALFLAL